MKKTLIMSAAILLLLAPLAAQKIVVLSPMYDSPGGVEKPYPWAWCVGDTRWILWNPEGSMQATVTIALRSMGSPSSAPPALVIATGTANDGAYQWTIPNTVAPGGYFLRVRTDDATVIGDGPNFAVYSRPVIYVSQPPHGYDVYSGGDKVTVEWKKQCIMQDKVTITLRAEGSPSDAAPVLVIATGEANDGKYSPWTIPDAIEPGKYFVRVRTDDATVIGNGSVFKIAKESITVKEPNGGEKWAIGTRRKIEWKHEYAKGKLHLNLMQNGKYKGRIATLFSNIYNYKPFQWQVGRLENGKIVDPGEGYRVRVVKDYPGPVMPILVLADESDGDFTISPENKIIENLK